MTLTELLRPIKERLAKATPGPLEVVRFDNTSGSIAYQVETKIGEDHRILGWFTDLDNPKAKADATLAAHAPADLAKLIAALERADAALDNAENVLRIIYHTADGTTSIRANECAQAIIEARSEIAAILKEGVERGIKIDAMIGYYEYNSQIFS